MRGNKLMRSKGLSSKTPRKGAYISGATYNTGTQVLTFLSADNPPVTVTLSGATNLWTLDSTTIHPVDAAYKALIGKVGTTTYKLDVVGSTQLSGAVTIADNYTLPTAAPGTNDYVLVGQTDGTVAWAAQSGGGGSSPWTSGSGFLHPTVTTDDIVIGASAQTAATVQLDIQGTGTAKANFDPVAITNKVNAADMDGTATSILFNQYYYNASSPAIADMGRLKFATEQDWTSTASTQDASFALQLALNGTLGDKFTVSSGGDITFTGDVTSGEWKGTAIANSYVASSSNWNTAYNDHITAVGYSSPTLTLTQKDAGTITTSIPGGAATGTVDTSGTPVDDDFAKFTDADTIEGRSYSEVKSDLGLGTAAERAAEDTLTDGSNLPDGAAIKAYGDSNWSDAGTVTGGGANNYLAH